MRTCRAHLLNHSSKDNQHAIALRQWLVEQNPPLTNEIFLDLYQDTGTQSGARRTDALRRSSHGLTRASLGLALMLAGCPEEAMAAANGLVDTAEASHNPLVLSYALFTYGIAHRDADSVRALDAMRRGLVIAQDSGNRYAESLLAVILSRLEAEHGDPLAALDYVTVLIRNFHDAGNTTGVRSALAMLAALFDRLGRYEPAATIAGFAVSPLSATLPEFNTAITHLREVLGDQTYESLARKGETMTTAAMATYAYDQIDQARAELNPVSK
jgi:tetratricopeptide (TPR) repeat protein